MKSERVVERERMRMRIYLNCQRVVNCLVNIYYILGIRGVSRFFFNQGQISFLR